MANAVWQATIVDQSGNVLPGAEVEVVNEATGLPAPLFTTRTGTSKSNPFFADANGFAQFYAAPGLYRITATSAGTGTTMTWRNVRLVDVATNAEAIAGAAGVLPDAAGVAAFVRQYGIGSHSVNVATNFNILDNPLTPNGLYEVTEFGWSASPSGTHQWRIIHMRHSNASGYATQIALAFNSNRAFIRTSFNSLTFGSWVELYHTGNTVGTVSQSGGVPTGAIIQRGSNANGEFVRFADGTQICTHKTTNIVTLCNISAGTLFRTGHSGNGWTYPVSFVGGSFTSVSITLENNGTEFDLWVADLRLAGLSSATWEFLSSRNGIIYQGCSVHLTAIGRWY